MIKTIGIIRYQRDGAIVVIVDACVNKDKDYSSKNFYFGSAQNDSLKATNQKMQSQIDKLVQRMNSLELAQQECCNNISSQSIISNSQTISGNNQPRLEQNLPNPFNNNTIVRYYIPANTSNAQIVVTDISGHTLKNILLETKGSGQVTITGGTLSSGSYIYSLLINGRKVDSKQMVLTK